MTATAGFSEGACPLLHFPIGFQHEIADRFYLHLCSIHVHSASDFFRLATHFGRDGESPGFVGEFRKREPVKSSWNIQFPTTDGSGIAKRENFDLHDFLTIGGGVSFLKNQSFSIFLSGNAFSTSSILP
jgi:hypothetical protein